jgi:hypothetical protein
MQQSTRQPLLPFTVRTPFPFRPRTRHRPRIPARTRAPRRTLNAPRRVRRPAPTGARCHVGGAMLPPTVVPTRAALPRATSRVRATWGESPRRAASGAAAQACTPAAVGVEGRRLRPQARGAPCFTAFAVCVVSTPRERLLRFPRLKRYPMAGRAGRICPVQYSIFGFSHRIVFTPAPSAAAGITQAVAFERGPGPRLPGKTMARPPWRQPRGGEPSAHTRIQSSGPIKSGRARRAEARPSAFVVA